MPRGVSWNNGISCFSSVCTSGFSGNEVVSPTGILYFRTGSLPRPHSTIRVPVSPSRGAAGKMLFSSFRRNFIGLILQFELTVNSMPFRGVEFIPPRSTIYYLSWNSPRAPGQISTLISSKYFSYISTIFIRDGVDPKARFFFPIYRRLILIFDRQ